MQAIETKYLPVTNTRPSRIKASCDASSIIVAWDYSLDIEENHINAASKLCKKLEWNKTIISGCLPSGNYAHVFLR
jgi:hypothetical protein